MTRNDLTKTGLALLCGAALALPAGFVLGRLGPPVEPPRSAARGDGTLRDMFSPSVRGDPYFLERQREGVAALERYCARTGKSCPEARAAHLRLSQLERRD